MFKCLSFLLPDSLMTYICLRIIRISIWYETKWLKFYVDQLLKTENYYLTLKNLNSNKWCSSNLAEIFITYARSHYNELVHS